MTLIPGNIPSTKEPEWQTRMTALEDVAKEAQRISAQTACKANTLMGPIANSSEGSCSPPVGQDLCSRLIAATDSLRASLTGIEFELKRIDC